jgi:DNA repair protein RadA/Sms
VASTYLGRAVPSDVVAVGEVGLGGEIRQVGQTARRLSEAARLGFARAVVPASVPPVAGIDIVAVRDVGEALAATGLGS